MPHPHTTHTHTPHTPHTPHTHTHIMYALFDGKTCSVFMTCPGRVTRLEDKTSVKTAMGFDSHIHWHPYLKRHLAQVSVMIRMQGEATQEKIITRINMERLVLCRQLQACVTSSLSLIFLKASFLLLRLYYP